MEACLDVCHPQKDGSGWDAESCVIDVDVQLNLTWPKVMGALQDTGVTWYITMSVAKSMVEPS
jgi:hypothetical protein